MPVAVQDDATEAEWYDVTKLPPLAFDHKLIVRTAFEHLIQQSETKSTGTVNSLCQNTQRKDNRDVRTKPVVPIPAL